MQSPTMLHRTVRSTALALLAGLPASVAAPALTDMRADGAPAPGRDLSGAFGAVGRAASGADGGLGTMDWDFENLPPAPAPVGGTYPVVWGGAWSGFAGSGGVSLTAGGGGVPASAVGGFSAPLGGNATIKLGCIVPPPGMGPNTFFGRWARMDILKSTNPNTRLVVRPDVGAPARIAHETFVTSIASLWTSEPTFVSSGFTISRVLWGGENATTGIGLPLGPIPDFYTLGPDPANFLGGIYTPLSYPEGHPNEGENVPAPVGAWFRLTHETNVDGELAIYFDPMDGTGELEVHRVPSLQVGRFDRLALGGGFEVGNDACYIDNLHVEGVEFTLPTPPALACAGGQYLDDERWLHFGPISGQSTRWVDAVSSRANVVEDPDDPADKVIRRQNLFPDDRYRQELRTQLPLTHAWAGNTFRACIQVELLSNPPLPYQTVHAIAPACAAEESLVTRLFIGRFDPTANPAYTPRVYVQINPAYDPIDDESTMTPYLPGPNGNGGVPIVGVDVADTGVDWLFDQQRTVCFEVAADRTMTVTLDGVGLYTGQAFVAAIDSLHLESENNNPGEGNVILYDDVSLTCTPLPNVTLPPLTLVYNDHLGWGVAGVTIGLHDDDANPETPFRWSSAPRMPLISGGALKLENLRRDTPAAAPNLPGFQSFEQAATRVPHVAGSSSRGWVAKSDNHLNDSATSRTWAVAQHMPGGAVRRVTALTYSSVTGTFWVQKPMPTMPEPFATVWEDTGTTLTGAGAALDGFFGVALHRNLSGTHTFRINGRLLRYTAGPNAGLPVQVNSQSSSDGLHKDLDRFMFFSSNEETAPAGSILLVDNIRAWSLPCLGDTNDNGVVDFADLNNVLGFFGQSGPPTTDLTGNIAPDADSNGVPDDNAVTFTDLNAVLSGFGVPCDDIN